MSSRSARRLSTTGSRSFVVRSSLSIVECFSVANCSNKSIILSSRRLWLSWLHVRAPVAASRAQLEWRSLGSESAQALGHSPSQRQVFQLALWHSGRRIGGIGCDGGLSAMDGIGYDASPATRAVCRRGKEQLRASLHSFVWVVRPPRASPGIKSL